MKILQPIARNVPIIPEDLLLIVIVKRGTSMMEIYYVPNALKTAQPVILFLNVQLVKTLTEILLIYVTLKKDISKR